MAELYRNDPAYAVDVLCGTLDDGDELDLALLLPQLAGSFDAIWSLVPGLASKLRQFFSDSDRLYWRPNGIDGWYCVPTETGFDVYHQQQSRPGKIAHFSDEKAAMFFVLKSALSRE
jgi:hypothetical protein